MSSPENYWANFQPFIRTFTENDVGKEILRVGHKRDCSYIGRVMILISLDEIDKKCKCGKNSTLRCSTCKITYYCGNECQKNNWNDHKPVCIKGMNPQFIARYKYGNAWNIDHTMYNSKLFINWGWVLVNEVKDIKYNRSISIYTDELRCPPYELNLFCNFKFPIEDLDQAFRLKYTLKDLQKCDIFYECDIGYKHLEKLYKNEITSNKLYQLLIDQIECNTDNKEKILKELAKHTITISSSVTDGLTQAVGRINRAQKIREVHPSFMDYICPVQSADTGEQANMAKQMAITSGAMSASFPPQRGIVLDYPGSRGSMLFSGFTDDSDDDDIANHTSSRDIDIPASTSGSISGYQKIKNTDGQIPDWALKLTECKDIKSDDNQCVICLENKRKICSVPCGHITVCGVCAFISYGRGEMKCLICRAKIEKFIEIYF